MLSVIIVIAIILLSIILAGIGAYVVIHSADEKEEIKPVIDVSANPSPQSSPARPPCVPGSKPRNSSPPNRGKS